MDGKQHSFLGHAKNVSGGNVVGIPRKKNKRAQMIERFLELDE
jgi:hypothetical protein